MNKTIQLTHDDKDNCDDRHRRKNYFSGSARLKTSRFYENLKSNCLDKTNTFSCDESIINNINEIPKTPSFIFQFFYYIYKFLKNPN